MAVIEKQNKEQEQEISQGVAEPKVLGDDYWEGELVPRSDPRAEFISVNPERLGGTACFVGTRVPIKHLWDYLAHDAALPEFLDDFEGVPREEVLQALQHAFDKLMEGLPDGRRAR